MAAPTYTWEFAYDLFGDRVPKIVTLEATTDLETKIGTMLIESGGQLDTTAGSDVTIIGLAAEATSEKATAGDPIKVALIGPGMVIKGTADADASALSGFNEKLVDMNTDGSLDVADDSNGSLAVHRTEDNGLTVYCVLSKGALFG
jgi:hypothetical protein